MQAVSNSEIRQRRKHESNGHRIVHDNVSEREKLSNVVSLSDLVFAISMIFGGCCTYVVPIQLFPYLTISLEMFCPLNNFWEPALMSVSCAGRCNNLSLGTLSSRICDYIRSNVFYNLPFPSKILTMEVQNIVMAHTDTTKSSPRSMGFASRCSDWRYPT